MKGPVERLVAKERAVIFGALALIVVMSGLYTIAGVGMNMSALEMTAMSGPLGLPADTGDMAAETGTMSGDGMEGMAMPMGWSFSFAVLVFLMWWIMMIAMMTPSAAPMILLFAALKRQGPESARANRFALVFLAGYLLAWAGFSAIATLVQWTLESSGLVDAAMMTLNSRLVAGTVLLAAGAYQFSAVKRACLEHCRSPAHFLAEHRRPGLPGALMTGAHHGVYCLGCCWALMALLFVGGLMNLYWILGLALYVLAEKLAPRPDLFTRGSGIVLILGGLYVIASGV